MSLAKPIDEIDEADILNLISNQVTEHERLEFKSEWPNENKQRDRLAEEIAALASAQGGDLLLGIKENSDGAASEVIDTTHNSMSGDEQAHALESLLISTISPKPQLDIRAVEVSNKGRIFVIRVWPTWIPHMTHRGRFYTRGTRGKHPMTWNEIRVAFNRYDGAAKNVRKWRETRLDLLRSNGHNWKAIQRGGAIMACHLSPLFPVPLGSAINSYIHRTNVIRPFFAHGYDRQIRADGVRTFSGGVGGASYSHLFRNGAIESVVEFENNPPQSPPTIYSDWFKPAAQPEPGVPSLRQQCKEYVESMQSIGVAYPILIGFSFLHSINLTLSREPISSSEAILDEAILQAGDNFDSTFDQIEEHVFNAFGLEHPRQQRN